MSEKQKTVSLHAKQLAKRGLNLLPARLRSRFTDLHKVRAHQMARLYRRGQPLRSEKQPVLFWVPGGMPLMLHVEGPIAAALRLRGVPVRAVICDGPFRACARRVIKDNMPIVRWPDLCVQCKADTSVVLKTLGIPYSYLGEYIPPSERNKLWEQAVSASWDNLDCFCYKGINVGRNVRSAIQRYLQGFPLNGNEAITREYAYSALMCAEAAARAMDQLSPSRIFMSHGIYVDWGPALHTALARNIPVTAWMASYLPARFYFRHVEDGLRIDFHNMGQAAWQDCVRNPLTDAQQARLAKFLEDRYHRHVSFDMKRFHQYSRATEELRKKYVSLAGKPVWGISSHINWDCVSDYSPMAFPSFDDWMLTTVREIIDIREVNWLVKIHPAEAWDNPASGVQRLIDRHFPSLPPHVRVIRAEDEISPLNYFELVDGGVTVYGTSGLEIALLGKPVILAGEAHYGGKGFTHDGLNRKTYRELLHRAAMLKPLTEEQLRLARRYAYCYFIQRQVPLPVVKDPESNWWHFQYGQREQLLPGRNPFVDFICERILDGGDFVMDESLVTVAETT
jgi:hypothetical protein